MNDIEMLCPACSSEEATVVYGEATMDGLTFPDEYYRCGSCGEEFHTYEQSMATSRAHTAAVRHSLGLLSPEDIKRIRHSFGLSQEQFELALGVGKKTVIRWEKGTVPPSSSANGLLWFAQNRPDAFRDYARTKGLDLRPVGDVVVAEVSTVTEESQPRVLRVSRAEGWVDYPMNDGGSTNANKPLREGIS